jgi:hypothetical protein
MLGTLRLRLLLLDDELDESLELHSLSLELEDDSELLELEELEDESELLDL